MDKFVEINKKRYHVEIWDTAGQEKYKALTKIFVKDSKIVIFVYDITTMSSFEEVDYWVKTVKEILGTSPIYGLVGNKKDLYSKEEVDEDLGRSKAEEIGAIFKLTSAKTEREGINDYLKQLVIEYLKKNGENVVVRTRGQTIDYSSEYQDKIHKKKMKEKCC